MGSSTKEITLELTPQVDLLYVNDEDLTLIDIARAACTDSKLYTNLADRLRMTKKLIEMGHESVLEHLMFTFEINCSRAALQQIARHRMASLSVQSTRYTLHKAKLSFYKYVPKDIPCIGQSCNDVAKYMLPESLMTKIIWSINLRSLRNFYKQRSSKTALAELQDICTLILESLKTCDYAHLIELITMEGTKV